MSCFELEKEILIIYNGKIALPNTCPLVIVETTNADYAKFLLCSSIIMKSHIGEHDHEVIKK